MQTLTILSLSWQHLLIVAVILLVLFGGRKIPEMMRGLGSGIKEFKDAVKEDDKKNADEPPVNSQTNSNQNTNSTTNSPH